MLFLVGALVIFDTVRVIYDASACHIYIKNVEALSFLTRLTHLASSLKILTAKLKMFQ